MFKCLRVSVKSYNFNVAVNILFILYRVLSASCILAHIFQLQRLEKTAAGYV